MVRSTVEQVAEETTAAMTDERSGCFADNWGALFFLRHLVSKISLDLTMQTFYANVTLSERSTHALDAKHCNLYWTRDGSSWD